MKPTNPFKSENRAVSPVIGVILMVAITVILAAVIGTFVLGLGDSLGDNQPTAQISTDISTNETNQILTIEHNGGDSIPTEELRVVVNEVGGSGEVEAEDVFDSRFSVGDSADGAFASDTDGDPTDIRVRIIHTPSESILLDRTTEVNNVGAFEDDGDFKSALNS